LSQHLTIALDAMGGDNAPEIVIDGVVIACERFPNAQFLLFGDRRRIDPLLSKQRHISKKLMSDIQNNLLVLKKNRR